MTFSKHHEITVFYLAYRIKIGNSNAAGFKQEQTPFQLAPPSPTTTLLLPKMIHTVL
jgi:hypothetical protein